MDYFIFENMKSTDKNIVLKEYSRSFLPANNRNFIRIPGKDGTVPRGDDSKQDVIIDCQVSILGNDEKEINQNIESANVWLSQRGKLTFWDMLDRYYVGEVVGEISIENQTKWGDFNLQFRCHPIKFSRLDHFVELEENTEFTNTGSYKTSGIITVTLDSDIDMIRYTLQDTGEFIQIEHDFIEGDTIIIDLEEEKVTKNGYSVQKDVYIESDFFSIPPGRCRITSNIGKGFLEYTERWL